MDAKATVDDDKSWALDPADAVAAAMTAAMDGFDGRRWSGGIFLVTSGKTKKLPA